MRKVRLNALIRYGLKLRKGNSSALLIDVKIGDYPLSFMLDTGATHMSIDRKLFNELSKEGIPFEVLGNVNISTANGVKTSLLYKCSIVIGTQKLTIPITITEVPDTADYAGVLGGSILEALEANINYKDCELELTLNDYLENDDNVWTAVKKEKLKRKGEVWEVYSKGCPNCDYMYQLQKKLGIYDKIKHIELGSDEHSELNIIVEEVPTFIVKCNGTITIYDKMDRPKLEDIKETYL